MDIAFENAGTRLHAQARGRGVAVAMLHGGMATHAAVEAYLGGLGDGFLVLAPDLRGCGASVSRTEIGWDLLADDLAALLNHVGAQTAVVGGVSGGTGAALRFALMQPERLAGLVLAHPVYAGAEQGYTDFQAARLGSLAGLPARVAAEGAGAFEAMFEGPQGAAIARAFAAVHEPSSVAAWGDFMASGAQPFESLSDLARITAPVLLVPGTDEMHPRSVAELYRAALLRVEWAEAPDDASIARAIADFCRRARG